MVPNDTHTPQGLLSLSLLPPDPFTNPHMYIHPPPLSRLGRRDMEGVRLQRLEAALPLLVV